MSGAGTALAETWRTYYNDRYGTTIQHPDYFQPGNPPDANDGLAFTSPDGASFSVFASYNALDFDLAGYQDFIVKNLEAGKVISYRAHGRDWFVISGTAGADNVFYKRYLLSHRRRDDRRLRYVLSGPPEAKIRPGRRADGEVISLGNRVSDAGQTLRGCPAYYQRTRTLLNCQGSS